VNNLRDTIADIAIDLDIWYPVQVCLGLQTVIATFETTGDSFGYMAVPVSSITLLGTGTVATGVYFDNFTLQIHYVNNPDCPYCVSGCECCDDETTSMLYAITFANVALSVPVDCADCLDWNDCWEISQIAPPDGTYCEWMKYDDELPCPPLGDDSSIIWPVEVV
ncbi:unnamed protein product, partial [marine sediment metagenome]